VSEGWHFDDLLGLPQDGVRHIGLIGGALIPMSPQSKFHVRVTRNLQAELDRQSPPGLRADSEMTVHVDDNNGPEAAGNVVRRVRRDPGGRGCVAELDGPRRR
jgi:hypothetical protein